MKRRHLTTTLYTLTTLLYLASIIAELHDEKTRRKLRKKMVAIRKQYAL